MAETATLSSKVQIAIREAIRTARAWKAGLTFAFVSKDTGELLVPVPKTQNLRGLAKRARPEEYRDRSNRI